MAAVCGIQRGIDDLVEDQEELQRVDRAGHQVVVGVLAVVEVEAAQLVLVEQDRDDVLDVDARGMVAQVDQHLGPWSEALAHA